MKKKKNIDSKERILAAAIELFGKKGFSAVGVREIAGKADVNVSMISYYYDSKVGLLKEIIELYFNNVSNILKNNVSEDTDVKEFSEIFIPVLVKFMRENTDLCKVAIFELPYDVPEIAEYKGKKIKEMVFAIMKNILTTMGMEENPEQIMPIIAPVLISMIFSNFLLGDIVKGIFDTKYDDEFYERYSKVLSSFFLNGIKGLTSEIKKGGL